MCTELCGESDCHGRGIVASLSTGVLLFNVASKKQLRSSAVTDDAISAAVLLSPRARLDPKPDSKSESDGKAPSHCHC